MLWCLLFVVCLLLCVVVSCVVCGSLFVVRCLMSFAFLLFLSGV